MEFTEAKENPNVTEEQVGPDPVPQEADKPVDPVNPINDPRGYSEIVEPGRIRMGTRIIPNVTPRPYIRQGAVDKMGVDLLDFFAQCHMTDVYLMLTGGPLKRDYLTAAQRASFLNDTHLRARYKALKDKGQASYDYDISTASMYDVDVASTQAYLQAKKLVEDMARYIAFLEGRLAACEAKLGIDITANDVVPGQEYFDEPGIRTPEEAAAINSTEG